MGPNLWLCQRTFSTVRRSRCAPPIKYTLLWTVLWVPNSGTVEGAPPQGLQWSMQFSYRYERVTCLSPSYFCELAVVFVVTWYTHSYEKPVTVMVPTTVQRSLLQWWSPFPFPARQSHFLHTSTTNNRNHRKTHITKQVWASSIFSCVRHEGDRKRFNLIWPATRMCEALNSFPSMPTVKII